MSSEDRGFGAGFGAGYGFGSDYGYVLSFDSGSGFGSGSGYGNGYGNGSGFGYGNGCGFGTGCRHGNGNGNGNGCFGRLIGWIGMYEVRLLEPWPYVRVGCQVYSVATWRARWGEIAEREELAVSKEEVRGLFDAI